MHKTCPICGTTFITDNPRARYCSTACREKGAKAARKDWERRTGYTAKQREKMRQRRATTTAKREEIREAEREERRRSYDLAAADRRAKLQREAEQGNYFALMQIHHPCSVEYWNAWRAYALDYAATTGRPSPAQVNGISVYADNFAEEVLQSIKDRHIIIKTDNYRSET